MDSRKPRLLAVADIAFFQGWVKQAGWVPHHETKIRSPCFNYKYNMYPTVRMV